MFIAVLVVCNLELERCNVEVYRDLIKTEEACYYQLGIGMTNFEDQGYSVPVYRCLRLLEEGETA